MNKGFTLLETVIYVALLSLLLVFFTAAFQIFTVSNRQNRAALEAELEARFLIAKIEQALFLTRLVNQPAPGISAWTLSVSPHGGGPVPLVFDLASGTARLARGGGAPIALTQSGVEVTELLFTHIAASGTAPAAVAVDLTVKSLTSGLPSPVEAVLENTIYLR